MHISRFVSLVAKPPLSSFYHRVAPVLCRTITAGHVHVRFGNVGGRNKDIRRKLDVFLGTWLTDPKRAVKYAYYMTERDKDPSNPEYGLKLYRTFYKEDDNWLMVFGREGGINPQTFHFVLSEPFLHKHKDDPPVKILVTQDVKGMLWVFVPYNRPEQVHSTHMMVLRDKLFLHQIYPDGTVGFQVYFKE